MFDIVGVTFSPNNWPDNPRLGSSKLHPHPGYLKQFLTSLEPEFLSAGSHERYTNPIINSPVDKERGGAIYFGASVYHQDFMSMLNVLAFSPDHPDAYDYVAYAAESTTPYSDNYLRQMRIVGSFGMEYAFEAMDEEDVPDQKITISQALWSFIQCEIEAWGKQLNPPALAKALGATTRGLPSQLCFGLCVEDGEDQVYRVWSRAIQIGQ